MYFIKYLFHEVLVKTFPILLLLSYMEQNIPTSHNTQLFNRENVMWCPPGLHFRTV